MCIGIIYDNNTNDSWHKIATDLAGVRTALKTIKLPLPIACIYDTTKGDFIEFNNNYLPYKKLLLEQANNIRKQYQYKNTTA